MASINTIARPYAKAVFADAQASAQLSAWGDVLRVLQLVMTHDEVVSLLKDPAVQPSDWQRFLMSICESAVAESTRTLGDRLANFIALLIEARRLLVLCEVATLYHRLRLRAEGVVEVEMVSAYPVTEQQKARFQSLMEKHFAATVQMSFSDDADLIGGALLRSGDWVMDGTVKRKLTRLAEKLSDIACAEE